MAGLVGRGSMAALTWLAPLLRYSGFSLAAMLATGMVARLGYAMCAIIAVIAVLMEVKPF